MTKLRDPKGGSVTLDERRSIFSEIEREILNCRGCQLWRSRRNPVPGEGNLQATLMFVGEGPGEQEDLKGRPFVGAAGKLLDQLIETLSLKRKDVFITNIVKCRPPGNRDPLPEEISSCQPFLIGQIGLICPRIICTLGRHAFHTLVDPQKSITRAHGQPTTKDGIIYFPTFHPAAALYHDSVLNQLIEDFQKLKALLKEV